ncbi:SpoVG family protein [Thalassoglobus sp. JC818]|uniref:SpoVG family protein n=1 Tax=Thalassoglobus sp. JC818 TaxID=3232136 RepID=UPI003459D775
MNITEVRIKLMECEYEDRLLGFCSITFDSAFVIRDLKIIRGTKGPFVAMPSRKLTDRCPKCGGKNQLRAAYCNHCGVALNDDRSHKHSDGKAKLYADIAHPIHSECRDMIQECVITAYEQEVVLAQTAEYVCRYDDYGEFDAVAISMGESEPELPQRDRNRQPVRRNGEATKDVKGRPSRAGGGMKVRMDERQQRQSPRPSRSTRSRKTANSETARSDEFGEGLF